MLRIHIKSDQDWSVSGEAGSLYRLFQPITNDTTGYYADVACSYSWQHKPDYKGRG